ncbi:MAG: LPS-assembly protein LptD [Treponema sp.]|jgi:hypothetical protein|nr:LPS-assembly protein LptD [Treponema sp.]
MKRAFFLLILFFSILFCAESQEDIDLQVQENTDLQDQEADQAALEKSKSVEENGKAALEAKTPAADNGQEILAMDIRTSSFMELAAWCRSLGLPEGGKKEDLASRLRRHYNLPSAGKKDSTEGKTVTIESARTTEYFTLELVNEEYARLRGDVKLTLKDGDATHTIKAWEILYNRTRNVITASGGVAYEKSEGNTTETFKGETITVNLDNWSSILADGVSERASTNSSTQNETAYRFAGTVVSRNAEEVTVLTRAVITNGNNEDSIWSLSASKLWLLPDSDWAVSNAVLKVGNIPVLWLPFFFYPSDEIVFHPVMGYRTRTGTFFQTTTYILGRPAKSAGFTENSITKIFGTGESGEKEREGLFLRKSSKASPPADKTIFSVLFDAYVNLGAYLGMELSLPKKGPMSSLNLSFGLGYTRNIYNENNPFNNNDGISDWNSSYFFLAEVPFRYRLEAKSSFSWKYASLSLNFPLYSDPYVNRDFITDRKEELDWLTMVREGATSGTEKQTDSMISSYNWSISSSINPRVTAMNPYISSLSISSISWNLNFLTRDSRKNSGIGGSVFENPDRRFFYPNRMGLSITSSMTGKPYPTKKNAVSPAKTGGQTAAGDSMLPALPRLPWEDSKTEKPSDGGTEPYKVDPPVLNQRFPLAQSGGTQLSFDYRLDPNIASELQFRTNRDNWTEADDIDWTEISSIQTSAGTRASMGISLSPSSGRLYSGSLRINGRGNWVDYSYINKDAEEFRNAGQIGTARASAHNRTNLNSSYDFTASLSPLYGNTIWGATTINYGLSGLIGDMKYDAAKSVVTDNEDDPRWKWISGKWDKKDISTHYTGINISANVMEYLQTISINSTLPPKNYTITGNAVARAWISETSVTASITELDKDSGSAADGNSWKKNPISLKETLKFGSAGSFSLSSTYNPEKPVDDWTSLSASLSLYGFNAVYTASHIVPYQFIDGSGWKQIGTDKEFLPQSLNFSYRKNYTINNIWNNRISLNFGADTSLNFNLQEYTRSSLTFIMNMAFNINKLLGITFSVSSANSQIYQYFRNLPFFSKYDVPLSPTLENNIFADLLNSFRFDNDALRRLSGFKLKTFGLKIDHYMGDWKAELGMNLIPYLDYDINAGHQVWKFNNQISFSIKWDPIQEVKTEFIYDKEKLTFK